VPEPQHRMRNDIGIFPFLALIGGSVCFSSQIYFSSFSALLPLARLERLTREDMDWSDVISKKGSRHYL
jgi:hypothetical protein